MTRFSGGYGIATAAFAIAVVGAAPASAAGKKTIGFALTGFHLAEPGTGEQECPEGYQFSSIDNFNAQYPDEKVRDKLGKSDPQVQGAPEHRGPNAESLSYQPWAVKDPLPLREVHSKIALGRSLDGTADGRDTPQSCKHEKFASADNSAPNVDNELYRVTACWKGMRAGGHPREFFDNQDMIANPKDRFLIEITDVDDEMNDDHVDVTFYKGRDKIIRDASGVPLPGLSQRVDRRDPDYTQHTTGKIVNGVLITDTMPMWTMPFIHGSFAVGEYQTKDMQLRLKIGPEQAKGIVSGYYDIWSWYFLHIKTAMPGVGGWAPSAIWQGLVRHADGYKDPQTGQCTAISSAYEVEAVRAFIVKDDQPVITADTHRVQPHAAQSAAAERQ